MAGNSLGFNSERRDAVCNSYHLGNGYRAYNPCTRRFNCPDSWSPFGAGGIHPYAFCAGDPVNRADPSGHFSWQAGLGMGLGMLGIIAAIFTGGASIAAAGSLSAALAGAETMTLAVGTSAFVADVTGVVSSAIGQRQPQASAVLGWLSVAGGMLSCGVALGAGGYRMLNEASSELRQRLGNIRNVGLSGRGAAGGSALIRSSSLTDFNMLYRYDQRSPREIMSTGFQGTRTHFTRHIYAAFQQETVFSSRTLAGVNAFHHIIQDELYSQGVREFTLDPNRYFLLYKINPQGRNFVDFSSEYLVKGKRFIQEIARNSDMHIYGHLNFSDLTYKSLRYKIPDSFVWVREVQIQGPITPDKITPVFPRRLDYLDLAWW